VARVIGRLTAIGVDRIRRAPAGEKIGVHSDGGGLYLQVTPSGAKSWLYCYRLHKRSREMGLGPLHAVSLADARQKAAECRAQRADDVDPIDARKAQQARAALEAARAITFKAAAELFIESNKPAWTNAKHADQWTATLAAYAYPVLGAAPVQTVDTGMIIRMLEPIWNSKTETASRLRGRVERILDWAAVRGYRTGENPARWRGHLEHQFGARSAVQKVEHHPALPYGDTGAFMTELHEQRVTAARALEFLILTVTRTSETIGGRWPEIDFEGKVWTIPAQRMKMKREHRVPLSAPAITLLKRLYDERTSEFIFPGARRGKPLSNMALLKLLERMDRDDITVHGFRSTFRDWAAECTNFPREVAEMALAHAVDDKVEAAYRRGDLFEKRRQLMTAWAGWCSKPAKASGNVVAMQKAAAE
jgi:integrase